MPQWIAVGDHHLRVLVQGQGSPAVIFEAFGPAYLEHMGRVQPEISRLTTTVNYEHAGHWFSEPGPKPRHANQIVHELHTVLEKTGVKPPYILVGFSFGGPYIRVFAGQYPEEVAGMVFIDPSQENFMRWINEEWKEVNVVTDAQKAAQEEWGCQWDSLDLAAQATLPEVPISMITGMRVDQNAFRSHCLPHWLAAHREWLAQYPQATHIVTTNSGHGVPLTEPGLVMDTIRDMLDKVRSQTDSP